MGTSVSPWCPGHVDELDRLADGAMMKCNRHRHGLPSADAKERFDGALRAVQHILNLDDDDDDDDEEEVDGIGGEGGEGGDGGEGGKGTGEATDDNANASASADMDALPPAASAADEEGSKVPGDEDDSGTAANELPPAAAALATTASLRGRRLHSSTFRLNVSAFDGIGCAFRGCFGGFKGVSRGITGCLGCILCQKRLRLS